MTKRFLSIYQLRVIGVSPKLPTVVSERFASHPQIGRYVVFVIKIHLVERRNY
jgi:hypothetical protein